MSGLVDSVMQHIGDPQIAQIAARLGTDPTQARAAIEHALPLIVGGMAQSASTAQGADALHNALGEHAGFNPSDILNGILAGAASGNVNPAATPGAYPLGPNSPMNPALGIGGAILSHIFGPSQNAANQGLGQVTGLGQQNAGALMSMLAPMVMGVLANTMQQHGMNAGSLGGMLGQQSQQIQQQGGLAGGLLGAVLGHTGGDMDLSHLMQGAGALFNMFGKR